MIEIGLAFLVVWLLYAVFTVTLVHSLLATAIIFIVLGLIVWMPWANNPWIKKP